MVMGGWKVNDVKVLIKIMPSLKSVTKTSVHWGSECQTSLILVWYLNGKNLSDRQMVRY